MVKGSLEFERRGKIRVAVFEANCSKQLGQHNKMITDHVLSFVHTLILQWEMTLNTFFNAAQPLTTTFSKARHGHREQGRGRNCRVISGVSQQTSSGKAGFQLRPKRFPRIKHK